MTSTFDRDRALLIRLWRSWAERARALSDEQWTAPTRLPGWTVRDLYVHVAPDALIALIADPAPEGTAKVTSAAEMLRVFNADPVAAEPMHRQIAEMVRHAATDAGRETLVERFAVELPQAFDRLTGLDRETVVPHPLLGSVTLGALLDLAILETTVHLLDVVDTVGGPPPESEALERTRNVLAAVPDARDFIEAASGRSGARILPVMR